MKKYLTTEERIRCAYLHYVRGVEQQELALDYRVNIGRVNEACKAIKLAAENPLTIREAWDEYVAYHGKPRRPR